MTPCYTRCKRIGQALLVLLCMSCNGPSPEQRAAQAAQDYYSRLAEGDVAGFVAGRAGSDSLPTGYRAQLEQAYGQYVRDVALRHGGLQRVSVSPQVGRQDSSQHVTYAFLLLSFNDSTQEEIVVPMTECNGQWRMK